MPALSGVEGSGATGKYRFESRLGGGGMAEVFVGSSVGAEGFSRRVAIKRVLPGFSDNPAFAQMFISEAQISSRLVHPNIVSVLDFDRDAEQRLFLVMELVEGKDLDALIATGLLPLPVVIHVIAEVLRGLGYAHNLPATDPAMRGVVHRDVSPHNVLVSWEGAVKVSDFGIAKARAASNATGSEFIKGKPQYMSPEQANGQPLDGRSDLFAVGVMLWEMVTGNRLFVGHTTQEVLARMLFAPISWPREIRPGAPVDLERVTMRLLERNIDARYATAEDAISDLLACADAPRGGRDELVAVMAERFPGQAPVRPVRRPSVQRSRQSAPQSPPTHHNAFASTAVGTPRAAETRTAAPAAASVPRRRIPLVLWIVLAAVVGLVGTVIVVAATSSKESAPLAAGGAADAAPAVAAVTVDAPPAPTPPPAAVAVDAAPPAPPVDARAKSTKPSARGCTFDRSTSARGTVEVTADPWAVVTIDGKRMPGQTPIQRPLPPGCHVVILENADLGKRTRREVEVVAGKTATVSVEW